MTGPILIFGKKGQVATALARTDWGGHQELHFLGRGDLDLRTAGAEGIARRINQIGPSLVINAAAYTAVDQAESEPAAAYALNAVAPGLIAQSCAAAAIPLIHISTDYVFDGTSAAPYAETDPICPVSVYGASKEAGERAVRAATPRHVIVRTAWVFSPSGRNFVKTMLRLGAARHELRIVDDQIGSPTSAADIAAALAQIAQRLRARPAPAPACGTYHFCAAGHTSWHGFAAAIFDAAHKRGFQAAPRLLPIPTSAYPTPARRPLNSRLACAKLSAAFGVTPRPWRAGLHACLDALLGPVRA